MSTPILIEPRRASNVRSIVTIIIVIVIILIIVILIWVFFINVSTSTTTTPTTTPTAGCLTDAGCTGGQKCHIVNNFGTCVSCLSNNDCANTPGKPVCFTTTGVCVQCRAPGDCKDPTKPTCNPANSSCVGCLVNGNCVGNPNGGLCDPTDTTCKQCLQDADCGNPNLACDFSTGKCINAFTCPAITVPTCDGSTISSGTPGQTYCADGLHQYQCTSPGQWQATGSLCVCPTLEYFVWNGILHNNGLSQFSNINSNTACQAICTPDSNCSGTTWDPSSNTCHTFTFPFTNGYTVYIEDPLQSDVYIINNNTNISGNDLNSYSNISGTQCFANCQAIGAGAGVPIIQYQISGGNCWCKALDQNGSNGNWLTSFKEVNF